MDSGFEPLIDTIAKINQFPLYFSDSSNNLRHKSTGNLALAVRPFSPIQLIRERGVVIWLGVPIILAEIVFIKENNVQDGYSRDVMVML